MEKHMKILIQAMQGLLILVTGVVFFILLMYHGSGHNIPLQTDVTFIGAIGIMGLIYFFLNLFKEQVEMNSDH